MILLTVTTSLRDSHSIQQRAKCLCVAVCLSVCLRARLSVTLNVTVQCAVVFNQRPLRRGHVRPCDYSP